MTLRTLLALLLLGLTCAAEEPKPLLVILDRNPWLGVIGSDSPVYALYADGTVIYALDDPAQGKELYCSQKVPHPEATVKELLTFDINKTDKHYELTTATDQITTLIWTPAKSISIYGDWRKPLDMGGLNDPKWKEIREFQKELWEKLPAKIRQSLARIEERCKLPGAPWLPSRVEVMFWPYEYAPDPSIVWPKDWPSLSSKDTTKRGTDSWSVYLPGELMPRLEAFIKTRKEKGAVLIEGKKMAISYRFPFPAERAWMK